VKLKSEEACGFIKSQRFDFLKRKLIFEHLEGELGSGLPFFIMAIINKKKFLRK